MECPTARPRAVIFDWDHTLADNWDAIRAALNFTLVSFGQQEWTVEETRARVKASLRDSFPILFGDRWEEARTIFLDHFAQNHLAMLNPLAGSADLLAHLREKGVYLAIVSNKRGPTLRLEVDHLGWRGYFGQVIGAEDATADKPSPIPVGMALAGSGIEPGPDVWFVGDTSIDMECAHNAGCVPVLIRDPYPDDAALVQFPPRWHAPHCTRVVEWLGAIV
ncbi:MAG: HAD family hydrolase [Alphaproteobacteria bacterium]|nr:HAD family hydrolase [Alphaproteobacteria bacterium]MBU0797053.1 HAD family hydrolase [Alphaproteobacteria bacterium]MBU0887861.1 HAD family hydrolase [Alphaproteobacteria bacterium]MBU1814916.1 HAD family hydrolase [Alphaproteobacteria bacterium]MBU2090506.1 HAD family hydrolase [Alphaproteobacteria bacterium]